MTMGIDISIVAGPTKDTSSVSASGSVQHVITDAEVGVFGIQDDALKNAVASPNGFSPGTRPNEAYLSSTTPTPWGDLYKTYGWDQVQTVLVADSASITGIDSKPPLIAEKTFTNNSGVAGTFKAGVSLQVANTSSSTWSDTYSMGFEQKFTYNVSFLGEGVGGETDLKFGAEFGHSHTEQSTVTEGTQDEVDVVLNPGQSVIARLTVSRSVLKVRITYRAYLIGSTALHYDPGYNGHNFWALEIGGQMAAGGISNSRTFTEDIEIDFSTDSRVTTTNPDGGTPPAPSDKVVVYDDSQYRGSSQELGVGRYDWGQIHNDAISSLRVPAGMRVTLYTDTHFQGGSKTFTQDTPYVGDDFNDRTSSIQVESGTAGTPHAPTGGVVVVYDDSQYRGYRQELGAGSYGWGQIHNDTISSLRVPAGMSVTLYTDTHFQGRSKTFTKDTPYVGDDFNDQTSSIVVRG
jgi:hypothetical protein